MDDEPEITVRTIGGRPMAFPGLRCRRPEPELEQYVWASLRLAKRIRNATERPVHVADLAAVMDCAKLMDAAVRTIYADVRGKTTGGHGEG